MSGDTIPITAAEVIIEPAEEHPDAKDPSTESPDAEGLSAVGLLVDRDVVLAPYPPPLLRGPGALRVTIRPVPGEGGPVERIPVAEVRILHVHDAEPAVTAAVLRLAVPSRYVVDVEPFSQGELTDALRAHQADLWAALRSLGFDAGPGVWPPRLPEDRATPLAANGVETRRVSSMEEFAAGGCRIIRPCMPPDPDEPFPGGSA